MRTGTARLPLHGGRAPAWLFQRMVRLAREIVAAIVLEQGRDEFLRKLADPFWFQALGSLLGFDWHSSGLTTTVCGALKEALKEAGNELGVFVCGGKGRVSRRTPQEIEAVADRLGLPGEKLVYASRMSAKVDSNAVQDGYQIYHHTFILTTEGKWAVVQQGMNEQTGWARRYHWLSDAVQRFVEEPHAGIVSEHPGETLNLVASESGAARETITQLSHEKPDKLIAELKRLPELELPRRHQVLLSDVHPERLSTVFEKTYDRQAEDFESLLGMPGVGAKTLRALSLLSEILYGAPPSFRDPARFSFAHGGKDGHPYPVDRRNYDRTTEILRKAIEKAKLGRREQLDALRRLSRIEASLAGGSG